MEKKSDVLVRIVHDDTDARILPLFPHILFLIFLIILVFLIFSSASFPSASSSSGGGGGGMKKQKMQLSPGGCASKHSKHITAVERCGYVVKIFLVKGKHFSINLKNAFFHLLRNLLRILLSDLLTLFLIVGSEKDIRIHASFSCIHKPRVDLLQREAVFDGERRFLGHGRIRCRVKEVDEGAYGVRRVSRRHEQFNRRIEWIECFFSFK